MRDIEYDPTTETAYECLNCGTVISVSTSPGRCPDCDGSLRNREMPFE
ncbi:rubrerythrin-like domain-containing protein [Halobium salinum]|uniref:Rubrerythrin-like domain-containing protein n=1 Tax=Halobium salinum TaxID=1364940 RepID=A0ABD5PCH8_9EURY|nr:rubrerythrin-like domain-containing protein [Halobium salinum]